MYSNRKKKVRKVDSGYFDKFYPLQIEVQNEDLEKAIKKFSKKIKKDGVIEKFISKLYYEKPSRIKHRKNMFKKLKNL